MKCLQNMQIDAITAQFVRIQMERVVDSMKIYPSLLHINFVFVECKWNSKRINYKLAFVHFLFTPRHGKYLWVYMINAFLCCFGETHS